MGKLREITCEPPGQGIEEVLAHLKSEHEEGVISAIAVAVVYRDGTPDHKNSHCPSFSAMIGSIERMKWRLMREAEKD